MLFILISAYFVILGTLAYNINVNTQQYENCK
jgi:hypothetical protein